MRIFWLTVVLAAMALPAQARPVSYPGGITAMQMNDADSHNLHIHYSPTAWYSLGYKAEYWRANDWWFEGMQANFLLNRWNAPGSQANLYFKGAVGGAYSDHAAFDHHTQLAGFGGLAADWETRRYFTSYENRLVEAGDIDGFFMQSARIGIAPYIGDYGDLHTWLMLQVNHNPTGDHPVTVTPLVRLFKDTHLIEAGISNRGDIMFNTVLRF